MTEERRMPIPRRTPEMARWNARYQELVTLRGGASRLTRLDRAELSRLLRAAAEVPPLAEQIATGHA